MGAVVPVLTPHVFQPVPLCLERLRLPAGSPQGTRGEEGGRELWDLARYLSHPLHVETTMALKVQVNLTDSAMKGCCGIHKYQESYLQETLADTQCTSPCWSCKIFKVVFNIQKDTKIHKKDSLEKLPSVLQSSRFVPRVREELSSYHFLSGIWKISLACQHMSARAPVPWGGFCSGLQ